MSRFLTILEVSQKQAYIFSSSKLQDNIRRSDEIAVITGIGYMQEALDMSGVQDRKIKLSDQLVYSGGGHTILEFETRSDANFVVKQVTRRILEELPEIEMFASTTEYDETKTPGMNIKELTKALEIKKSFRKASFHQGTFGIEKIDLNTARPVPAVKGAGIPLSTGGYQPPEGCCAVTRFEDLGGDKGEANFIAVVHIDGNAMGRRVEKISSSCGVGEWEEYKRRMKSFSESVTRDFSAAYSKMEERVRGPVLDSYWMNSGPLSEIPFKKKGNDICFPVRKIINEGDDICFVSEGRIGVACAAAFLEELDRQRNEEDKNTYAACAGVALVHQKYPFYRAYELAEQLCSNAKRFGVTLGTQAAGEENGAELGAGASCIDWHIEFGEIQDTLDDTRAEYETSDGARLELRPYLVKGPKELMEAEPVRHYRNFEKLMRRILNREDFYSSGALKQLRGVLKRGSNAASEYLKFHKIEEIGRDAYLEIYADPDYGLVGTGKKQDRKIFMETADGKTRSLIFDAIEMMDIYLPLKEEKEK